MNFVFLTFKDNLFDDNQSVILVSSLFKRISLVESSKLQYSVVSSAYISMLKTWLTLGKSLIYIRKSRGLRIEPCGTPSEMEFVLDFELL